MKDCYRKGGLNYKIMLISNSVIEWIEEKEQKRRFERILWVSPDRNKVCLFSLSEGNSIPIVVDAVEIEDALSDKRAIRLTEDPFLRLNKPDPVKKKHEYEKRDFYWSLIEHMVKDEPDIYDPRLRAALVREVESSRKVRYKDVLKYLRRYWKYGMTRDALFRENEKKGGSKDTRSIIEGDRSQSIHEGRSGKRGRRSLLELQDGKVGKNVTPADVLIFELSYRKFYLEEKLSLTKAFDQMLRQYYKIGTVVKNGVEVPILPPKGKRHTFDQFRYWVKKSEDIKNTLRTRHGKKVFELEYRAVLGNTAGMADGPGKLYQIDSTIVDLFLVSSYTGENIGKVVLYVVSDTFSRKVAGFYVGLEGANWEGYAMALANALENKQAFCALHGVEITEYEWDCAFKPEQIICDRGPEFIGLNSDMLSDSLGIHVSNTAPYRADWKPIVERMFGQLNTSVIHWQPGSTQGRRRKRGERAPEKDATLTIEDFTQLLIYTFLQYNQSHWIDSYPLSKEMIADQVKPIPDELWNWGISGSGGALPEMDPRLVRLNLLPRANATVTREGIMFKKMPYGCQRALDESWYEKAKNKSFKIEIAYDRRMTDVIYFINEKGEPVPCELLPREMDTFKGRRLEDVEEFLALKVLNRARHDEESTRVQRDAQIEDTVEKAKRKQSERQKQQPYVSPSNRGKVSKTERGAEKMRNRESESFDFREKPAAIAGELVPFEQPSPRLRQSKEQSVLSLLKKRREGNER